MAKKKKKKKNCYQKLSDKILNQIKQTVKDFKPNHQNNNLKTLFKISFQKTKTKKQKYLNCVQSNIKQSRKCSTPNIHISLHRHMFIPNFNLRNLNPNSAIKTKLKNLNSHKNQNQIQNKQKNYLSVLSLSLLRNFSLSSSATLRILSINSFLSRIPRFVTSTSSCTTLPLSRTCVSIPFLSLS